MGTAARETLRLEWFSAMSDRNLSSGVRSPPFSHSFSFTTHIQLVRMNRCLLRYSQLGCHQPVFRKAFHPLSRPVSTDSAANERRNADTVGNAMKDGEYAKTPKSKKTMAQLDEELRMKLEGRSGDGGAVGLELENGKPVAMKRGVRENMFRLI